MNANSAVTTGPSWCTTDADRHDDWTDETDGALHRIHAAELGQVQAVHPRYPRATIGVCLVADDVITFTPDSVTVTGAGLPRIEVDGPDGVTGSLTSAQARQLAHLLLDAATKVEAL